MEGSPRSKQGMSIRYRYSQIPGAQVNSKLKRLSPFASCHGLNPGGGAWGLVYWVLFLGANVWLEGGELRGDDLVKKNSIKVVVWDEQQPKQKQAYSDFLGNEIAQYLKKQKGLVVRSVALDDPQQGLGPSTLDSCHVLIWWGHVRHLAVDDKTGKKIVERIKAGNLSLIALHSAHWSTPFVMAMNERTRLDSFQRFGAANDHRSYQFVAPKNRFTVPDQNDLLTPSYYPRKFPNGTEKVQVRLPLCVFPSYRADGKPSQIRCLKPDHPIAKGLPKKFELPGTEMYDEPFHIPEPDEVVFEERWETGEWFRSGCLWNIGKGKVFYFRPGHENYPVFKQENALKVIENAVRYLAD